MALPATSIYEGITLAPPPQGPESPYPSLPPPGRSNMHPSLPPVMPLPLSLLRGPSILRGIMLGRGVTSLLS